MKKNILAIIASLGMASLAQAAVQVSQPLGAPVDNIILAADGYNSEQFNWGHYGTTTSSIRDGGQSFLAPADFNLESFTFKIAAFESQAEGASFTVKIFETNNSTTLLHQGVLRSTQTGILPGTLSTGFITFKLDESVALSANRYYTVMLHFNEKGTNVSSPRRLIKFAMGPVTGEGPLGAGSRIWMSSDLEFTEYKMNSNSNVLNSYFQGTAAIPEPGSVALLIGGGLAFAALSHSRARGLMFRSQKKD